MNKKILSLCLMGLIFQSCASRRVYNQNSRGLSNNTPFQIQEVDFDGKPFTQVTVTGDAQSEAGLLTALFTHEKNKIAVFTQGDAVDFIVSATGTERLSQCSQKFKNSVFSYTCELIFSTRDFSPVGEKVKLDEDKRLLVLTAKRRNSGTETLYWLSKRAENPISNLTCKAYDSDGQEVDLPDEYSNYACEWKY